MSRSAPHARKVLVRNAISSYGARGAMGLSALIVTPVLFRQFGVSGFGTWSVIATFATVFSLGELGFARGLTKVTAELLATDRRLELERSFGVSVTTLFAMGVAFAATAVLVGFAASGLAASGFEHDFRWGMVVLGVERLLYFPLSACGAALAGHQRYDLYQATTAANNVAFTGAALVLVGSGGSLLGVVIAMAAAHLAGGLLQVLFLHRVDPRLRLRPRLGTRELRRRLTGFSSFVLLAESMTFIGQRMDTIVIAAIRSGAAAGPYAAALKLQTAVQSLTLPFVYLLMPMVSDLWSRGRTSVVAQRLALATRISCQLVLPVAAALAIFSEDVMKVWLGDGATSIAWQILIVLMLTQIPALLSAPSEQVLIGIGRVRAVGTLAFVEGMGNLAVSIALVWRYGAIGAALGTLATTAVLAPIKIPLALRALGSSARDFFAGSIVPAIAASLPAIAAMIVVWAELEPGATRLVVGVVVGLAFGLAGVVVTAGPARVGQALQKLGGRAPAARGTNPIVSFSAAGKEV